jgi:hypothetical protein
MDKYDKKNYNNVRSIFHIKDILIDKKTANKLWNKHGIEPWQVLEAGLAAKELFAWDESPEHGVRFTAIVETVDSQYMQIVLQLIDMKKGRWKLITAYYTKGDA